MEIVPEDFFRVDIRVGKIREVLTFPEAKKPAYKLIIDFGTQIGIKKSSAQITDNYSPDDLQGTLILAVVNFPPKQIGSWMSEVLVLGVPDKEGRTMLISPDEDVPLGGRVH